MGRGGLWQGRGVRHRLSIWQHWALFVDPDHEGRGHGKALHSAMVSWLWAQGLRHLWLTTGLGTRAEAFYRALGWRPSGIVSSGELRLELDGP
ncbi:MAG: GNAT family N-acetyltransferase [Steroidobacteraceae bacterium]|nr:GNAT family N-acetyltransferase [Pseudomonadota bacterium]MBP7610404.1 GNAT family N-acetyltransferase [Steroidobacteraceae bacterium]MBP9128784.1 GNAT family N-acetyltransferase [Steroidobacteraceae bacterium]